MVVDVLLAVLATMATFQWAVIVYLALTLAGMRERLARLEGSPGSDDERRWP